MSNTISTRTSMPTVPPIPPIPSSRPAVGTGKQPPKDTNPLSNPNPNPLSIATKPGSADEPGSAPLRARQAAEGLVSTTFIEPILKQVRESNDTPPPFGPSRAEKQFASLLDTELADEIVRAANFPLVERITAQLLRNMPEHTTQPRLLDDARPLDIEG